MNIRDCALGAVIAALIFAGANAGTPAQPVLGKPTLMGGLFAERSGAEIVRGLTTVRFCVGVVLDIAGEFTARAKQI